MAAAGANLVPGDLLDPAALQQLLHGADWLLHCAGAVRGARQQDFDAPNITGSANLVAAAAQQPVPPRGVMLSSIVAREPQLSWYARSKREAERVLHESPTAPRWTVLRPPAVYGSGDRELRPLLDWMTRGLALVPGAVAARTSLLHVEDLVAACLCCADSDTAAGQTFELHDGTPGGYDWPALAATVGRVRGRRVRILRLPKPLLDAAAGLNLLAARLGGARPMLTPAKLRELRHPDWVADNGPITAATSWRPRIDLAAGLARLYG